MNLSRTLLLLVLSWGLSPGAWAADEPVFSGPQRGEKLSPFKVFIATGPRKGQETDLIAEFAGAPTVLVFVHELTRPAGALMRPLDLFQQKRAADGLKLAFVFLPRDRTEQEQRLPLVANSLRMETPLTLSVDGAEGPGNYGLNRNVQVTALVAKGNMVTASFALVQPNEMDVPKILAEVVKLIGGTVPPLSELDTRRAMAAPARDAAAGGRADVPAPNARTPERPNAPAASAEIASLQQEVTALRSQYADLIAVVNELRREMAQVKGQPAPTPLRTPPPAVERPAETARPAAERAPAPAGANARDPRLEGLFRSLIQRDLPTERADRLVKELAAYVGDNKMLQKQATEITTAILTRSYGTPYAQQLLRGQQEKWR